MESQGNNAPKSEVKRKQHFKGKVAKIALGGAIIDLGLHHPGMVHISRLREEPVSRVEEVLELGQEVDVWVRRVDKKTGGIELTMIKPLDLEWRDIKKGLVLKGTISRIETYGVFVEIGAERPGMIHISELSHDFVRNPYEVVQMGDEVDVEVLDFDRRKKQIKLSRKAQLQKPAPPEEEVLPSTYEETVEEQDEDDNTPVPTALEFALRKAMKDNKGGKAGEKKSKKNTRRGDALDDIFDRTLQGYQPEK